MAEWENISLNEDLFLNSDPSILSRATAAVENCYMNAAGGYTRFPAPKPFVDIASKAMYLFPWRGHIIAINDEGKFYRVDMDGNASDVTGVPLGGGKRPVGDETENEFVVAAGGQILRFAGDRSEVLAASAPLTTHIAFIDGHLIAPEPESNRWRYTDDYRTWPAVNILTAEATPDPIIAAIVTPYRELLMAGERSIEQFESVSVQGQSAPFARRWTTGEGILAPYTLLAIDNGTYGVNLKREFVRFTGQVTRPESENIDLALQEVDDWTGAWTAEMALTGQQFLLLSIPNATNMYGTKGMTFIFDYRARRWFTLYDWDEENGVPIGWEATSYLALNGRHFVGVPGGIKELDREAFCNCGTPQRVLVRSGHVDKWGPSKIEDLRIRVKRGGGGKVSIRVNKDNRGWSRRITKPLGETGDRPMIMHFGNFGAAETWQFEIEVTDRVPFEFVGMQVRVERLAR